jgi:hypothetical protein
MIPSSNIPPNAGDYHVAAKNNKDKFMEMMKIASPEFFIVANQMEKSKTNPVILFHVINHMAEIATGTGYGMVHIVIEDGLVRFVKGEHSTKLNEPVIKDNEII